MIAKVYPTEVGQKASSKGPTDPLGEPAERFAVTSQSLGARSRILGTPRRYQRLWDGWDGVSAG